MESNFRDKLSTVTEDGKRIWLYPKKPKGHFFNLRIVVSIVLICVMIGVPFIKVNNQSLFLFDFLNRKFILFGIVFWPQDSYIFFLMFISTIIFIVLFTSIFGRFFCGWACPQTIFMEMIFRRIEYWLEGNHAKQRQFDAAPWTTKKVAIKVLKHFIFWCISFVIINILLLWLIGVDQWKTLMTVSIFTSPVKLAVVLLFSTAFYLIYAYFREQICLIVCPYGRLQGVLLDSNCLIVAYDYRRGEPRGKLKPKENRTDANKGDCVDCDNCVSVCPTGIDIRNGTQLECTNCTACIDACNFVMKRTGKPNGLIRIASENEIATGQKFRFTARVKAYSLVFGIMLTFLIYLLVTRTEFEATILHTPGTLYQMQDSNKISNLYNVKIMNKTERNIPVVIKIISPKGEIKMMDSSLIAKPSARTEAVFFAVFDNSLITKERNDVVFGIYDGERLIKKINSTFLGKNNNQNK